MKFTAWFSIIVGILMFCQWAFFIAAGQVPEFQTEPYSISLHLGAEALTAIGLVISGIALLKGTAWARTLSFLSLGSLTYSTIASPGYFADQGVWPLVAMFAILLVLAWIGAFRLANLTGTSVSQ